MQKNHKIMMRMTNHEKTMSEMEGLTDRAKFVGPFDTAGGPIKWTVGDLTAERIALVTKSTAAAKTKGHCL